MSLKENSFENTALELIQNEGYELLDDSDIWLSARNYSDFINEYALRNAIIKINKNNDLTEQNIEDVIDKLKNISGSNLFLKNKQFTNFLVNGVSIKYKKFSDETKNIKIVDYGNVLNNKFQVVHQIKFKENKEVRRPDIIIYINGLPLIIFELKNFDEGRADNLIYEAYKQLGENKEDSGYRYDIPTLFNYNAFNIISDGVVAKVGTITSNFTMFSEWKSINGGEPYLENYSKKINTLIKGMLNKRTIIDILENGLFYLDKNKNKSQEVKILTKYHQYFGVLKSLSNIKKHMKPKGDGKAGIVWHTQGSGKSYSMVMLAHRLMTDLSLGCVPTVVVLTDRISLDNQLFLTFSDTKEFLRTSNIEQASSREELLEKLGKVKQGKIIFTTLYKVSKNVNIRNLSDNIIVFADEAHRSHYGIEEKLVTKIDETTGDKILVSKFGMEKYIRDFLPNATFIGFTGTPISDDKRSTEEIFGDIVDVYDMTQSIEDKSTVKIFKENRLAKVALARPDLVKEIDNYYKSIEDDVDQDIINKSKNSMARITRIMEDEDLLELLAKDIIEHYNQRKTILNGKAMIVMSNRNSVIKIYKIIIRLYPQLKGVVVPIITEDNRDSAETRKICGDSNYRNQMAEKFKSDDPNEKFKIAIVCDMWLTGFDVPDLDTMYIFKPLKSHNLMQAIARVNRVYKNKEAGLIVDYIGLTKALTDALKIYTKRDQHENLQEIKDQAKDLLIDEYIAQLNLMFKGPDILGFISSNDSKKYEIIQENVDSLFKQGEEVVIEFKNLTSKVKRAYRISSTVLTDKQKQQAQFYLTLRSFVMRLQNDKKPYLSLSEINIKVEKLLDEAIKGDYVENLGTESDEKNNDKSTIDLLNEKTIQKLKEMFKPHIYVQMMKKLLQESISQYKKTNKIKSLEFSEKLNNIMDKYNNRNENFNLFSTLEALSNFANDIIKDENSQNSKGLNAKEKAFYDALVRDRSAILSMPDETLINIAYELKDIIEKTVNVDWTKKESIKAQMRRQIKTLLRKYNYPPEYATEAIHNIIEQAEYIMDSE